MDFLLIAWRRLEVWVGSEKRVSERGGEELAVECIVIDIMPGVRT